MTKYCTHCGNELNEDGICLDCGNVADPPIIKNDETKRNDKKLAILSIVFGVLGIYPLLGIGGMIGMMIAKKGLKIENSAYKKQLKIGYWISYFGLAFWLIAFLITLLNACSQVLRDAWGLGLLQMLFEFFKYFVEGFLKSLFSS